MGIFIEQDGVIAEQTRLRLENGLHLIHLGIFLMGNWVSNVVEALEILQNLTDGYGAVNG